MCQQPSEEKLLRKGGDADVRGYLWLRCNKSWEETPGLTYVKVIVDLAVQFR